MDQNSTNGAGTDKRNWRERLGIGSKEMPRLSDEFRAAPPAASEPPAAGTAKPAPRAPQPVTRPAPMAPRASAQKPVAAPAAAPTAHPRPMPPPVAQQDALAEKLRAQRAAAERLAEQRVQAARERAEGRSRPAEPVLKMPSRQPAAGAPATEAATGPRPKFSFAEDEMPQRKDGRTAAETSPPSPRPTLSGSAAPLTPPRPALGGERGQPSFLRPASGGASHGATQRNDAYPAHRTVEPGAGYTPPPRYTPPPPPRGGYGAEPGQYAPRPPVRRPPPLDPYARGYEGEEFDDGPRAQPRLTRPAPIRSRAQPAADDFEEMFEDEPAPRQRASARDYQAAYRETEAGYDDEKRRSSGPWLLLLFLLLAAVVTGGVVWFYNTKMRTVATGQTTGESVPVIAAPEQPAKVAPEQPVESPTAVPALKKKQIYDRIVGDQEVTGDAVVPTEEVPVQPAAAEDAAGALPDDGAVPIPAPDAASDALPATDEPVPLPLPPPPGNDQQGGLDKQGLERIAASAAEQLPDAAAPPGAAQSVETPDVATLPPPEKNTAGAVDASGSDSNPVEAAPPPPKKKVATAKAKEAPASKKVTSAEEVSGGEPVVLVPPAQVPGSPPSQASQQVSQPVSQQGDATPVKKKKTLFDLFKNGSSDVGAEAPPPAADDTQVASLPSAAPAPAPPAASAPAPQSAPVPQVSSGGSGYVVQLASFRTEAEAQNEYGRLKGRYPDVVGSLSPRISQASLGGSTRYNLGLGPVASRDQASRVCNSLFAAGERDCLVRSQ